jgi:ABC-type polysaccharide/polyol phosphate transport system ATPase subunit
MSFSASDALLADHVHKRYDLGVERYRTAKEALTGLRRRVRGERATRDDTVDALSDLSFAVKRGERVGVIGRNGSGKTTLLKVLGGVTDPTRGTVSTRGRLGLLLEVGTGFHPELTGRENVYLNGALLGMRRTEVAQRIDEIVGFAEVEPFIDVPIKRYSTGMELRLAFSVAAHLRADVMLVDEVLAVGDYEFQQRCLDQMSGLSRQGRTLVFVSHDLGAVNQLCDRAIWLDRGQLRADGEPAAVINQYLHSFQPADGAPEQVELSGGAVQVHDVRLEDEKGTRLNRPRRGRALRIALDYSVARRAAGMDVAIWISDRAGTRVIDERWSDREEAVGLGDVGPHDISLSLPAILPAGDYLIGVWFGSETETFIYTEAFGFHVEPSPSDREESVKRRRAAQPPVQWARSGDARR